MNNELETFEFESVLKPSCYTDIDMAPATTYDEPVYDNLYAVPGV